MVGSTSHLPLGLALLANHLSLHLTFYLFKDMVGRDDQQLPLWDVFLKCGKIF